MSGAVDETFGLVAARLRQGPNGTADLRRFRKTLSREIGDWDRGAALDLISRIIALGSFIGYELAANHEATRTSLDRREVEALGGGLCDWVSVDCFAVFISGPAWRAGQLQDEVIRDWTGRSNRWWRRAALVSTIPLNVKSQGGKGDAPRTTDICRRLLADRDDMVVKAMSWALRALAKPEPAATAAFLEENRAAMAKLVIREVTSKLTTGVKR